nr:MAG TPA: hypothetical protein [Caudoviricetes sp.]
MKNNWWKIWWKFKKIDLNTLSLSNIQFRFGPPNLPLLPFVIFAPLTIFVGVAQPFGS